MDRWTESSQTPHDANSSKEPKAGRWLLGASRGKTGEGARPGTGSAVAHHLQHDFAFLGPQEVGPAAGRSRWWPSWTAMTFCSLNCSPKPM